MDSTKTDGPNLDRALRGWRALRAELKIVPEHRDLEMLRLGYMYGVYSEVAHQIIDELNKGEP
jgi:hypothetical protein